MFVPYVVNKLILCSFLAVAFALLQKDQNNRNTWLQKSLRCRYWLIPTLSHTFIHT